MSGQRVQRTPAFRRLPSSTSVDRGLFLPVDQECVGGGVQQFLRQRIPGQRLVPPEGAKPYAVTTVTLEQARAWIRGTKPLPGTDRRVFLTEVPDRELPRSMRP